MLYMVVFLYTKLFYFLNVLLYKVNKNCGVEGDVCNYHEINVTMQNTALYLFLSLCIM